MKKLYYIILLLLLQVTTFAQVPPYPDQGENASGGPGGPSTPPTPIDNHILLLVSLGLIIGVYVFYRNSYHKKIFSK